MENNIIPNNVLNSPKKHFNDKHLVGFLAGIGTSILFIAIVLLGYAVLEGNAPKISDSNSSISNITYTTTVMTTTPVATVTMTPAMTTSISMTTAIPATNTISIDKNLLFDKTSLTVKPGDHVFIKNNSGKTLGGSGNTVYLTADTISQDSLTPELKNGETYEYTFTNGSGSRNLKVQQADKDGNINIEISKLIVTVK